MDNRKQGARILSKKEYVGADYEVIANSMTGTFLFQKTDRREMPDFNVFYRYCGRRSSPFPSASCAALARW